MRRLLALGALVAGSVVGIAAAPPPRRRAPRARRPLLRGRLDGVARRGRARGRAAAPARARRARSRPRRMNDAELRGRARASTRTSRATSCCARGAARATTSTSTASRRGPTCSRPLGERHRGGGRRARARRGAARRPGARRRRARGGRLARVRPAVPDRPQGGEGVRHREPARGRLRAGRARLPRRGRRHLGRRRVEAVEALREAGLECRTAVCVVDREEGGVGRSRARMRSGCGRSFGPASCSQRPKTPQTRMVEPKSDGLLGSAAVPERPRDRRRVQ